MRQTQISAEIVAHSLSPQGDELISVLCTFPRIILAEVNTHRMLSKNTSSSRAIPFSKMVEAVQNDPFIPIAWQKHHSGMQGNEYLSHPLEIKEAQQMWKKSLDYALISAKDVYRTGITKQLANRLLEPFMWTTMLITGSKEGWDNFFELRCPNYEVFTLSGIYNVKSCREAKELALHPNEFETFEIALQHNKGQAEIHMMALAESIYDAVNESVPQQLKVGDWHIPFTGKIDISGDFNKQMQPYFKEKLPKKNGDFPSFDASMFHKVQNELLVKVSTAMAARTSYTVVGDEKEIDYQKMIDLHDRLISQDPPHSSPLEHCAKAMSDEEYYSLIKGQIDSKIDVDGFINIEGHTNLNVFGWCGPYKGFMSYRYFIDNNLKV